jgi:hypothetical protein
MGGKRLTYEQVKAYFLENGCKLLSCSYLYSTDKLTYRCCCGNTSTIEFRNFKQGKRCNACRDSRSLETNRKNHGGKLCFQTEEFLIKRKEKCIKIYGVDNPLKNEEIKANRRKTNMERYGVPTASTLKHVQDKRKKTMKERYGRESALSIPEFKVAVPVETVGEANGT